MTVDPSNSFDILWDSVVQRGIMHGIDAVAAASSHRATLILIFAAIDAMARLDRIKTEQTREDFIRWAEQYLTFTQGEKLPGVEVYAARCGILHAYGVTSDLSRAGKVRKIAYATGYSRAEFRGRDIATDGVEPDMVVIRMEGLLEAFREGVKRFHDDTAYDDRRRATVTARLTEMFEELPDDEELTNEAQMYGGSVGPSGPLVKTEEANLDFEPKLSDDKTMLTIRLGAEERALSAVEVELAIATLCEARSLMTPAVALDPPPLDQHWTLTPTKLAPQIKKDRTEALLSYRDPGRGWIAIRLETAATLAISQAFGQVSPPPPTSHQKH